MDVVLLMTSSSTNSQSCTSKESNRQRISKKHIKRSSENVSRVNFVVFVTVTDLIIYLLWIEGIWKAQNDDDPFNTLKETFTKMVDRKQ